MNIFDYLNTETLVKSFQQSHFEYIGDIFKKRDVVIGLMIPAHRRAIDKNVSSQLIVSPFNDFIEQFSGDYVISGRIVAELLEPLGFLKKTAHKIARGLQLVNPDIFLYQKYIATLKTDYENDKLNPTGQWTDLIVLQKSKYEKIRALYVPKTNVLAEPFA